MLQKPSFLDVGAGIARPPKNGFFGSRRIFALRRRILLGQNPRTTNGRPYSLPFYYADKAVFQSPYWVELPKNCNLLYTH
jgi:hypothetical protein